MGVRGTIREGFLEGVMLDQRPEEGGRLREALQSRSSQCKGLEAESMVCWHEESGRSWRGSWQVREASSHPLKILE